MIGSELRGGFSENERSSTTTGAQGGGAGEASSLSRSSPDVRAILDGDSSRELGWLARDIVQWQHHGCGDIVLRDESHPGRARSHRNTVVFQHDSEVVIEVLEKCAFHDHLWVNIAAQPNGGCFGEIRRERRTSKEEQKTSADRPIVDVNISNVKVTVGGVEVFGHMARLSEEIQNTNTNPSNWSLERTTKAKASFGTGKGKYKNKGMTNTTSRQARQDFTKWRRHGH